MFMTADEVRKLGEEKYLEKCREELRKKSTVFKQAHLKAVYDYFYKQVEIGIKAASESGSMQYFLELNPNWYENTVAEDNELITWDDIKEIRDKNMFDPIVNELKEKGFDVDYCLVEDDIDFDTTCKVPHLFVKW